MPESEMDSLEELLSSIPPRLIDKMPEMNEDVALEPSERDLSDWAITPISLGIISARNIKTDRVFVGRSALFYSLFQTE